MSDQLLPDFDGPGSQPDAARPGPKKPRRRPAKKKARAVPAPKPAKRVLKKRRVRKIGKQVVAKPYAEPRFALLFQVCIQMVQLLAAATLSKAERKEVLRSVGEVADSLP